MWSCTCSVSCMMLRIVLAFSGILISSAFSTARTEVNACVPVQTPQIRSVNAQESRGSRPRRITSMPRHIVPVETALRMTLLLSTFTSSRRWPSMRVTGSTTMRWPELSRLKPFGVWIPMSDVPLGGKPLHRGDAGMDGHTRANNPGHSAADHVGIGLHSELIDGGQTVVERALVPEPVFRAANTTVAGLDRERDAVIPTHR